MEVFERERAVKVEEGYVGVSKVGQCTFDDYTTITVSMSDKECKAWTS